MYTAMNFHTKVFRNPTVELFSGGSNCRMFTRTNASISKRRTYRTAKLILTDDKAVERLYIH
jgi:hypothetical protein